LSRVQVRWSVAAKTDITRLHAFLRRKNPRAAARAVATIREAVPLLKRMPLIGRAMDDDSGRRELWRAFGGGAYILRYRLDIHGDVFIIRVWHSREDRS
jgi:plasmid stabilization system protein ParE